MSKNSSRKSSHISKKSQNEPIDIFNDDFLSSKDLALQPIKFFLDPEIGEQFSKNQKNLSLNTVVEKGKMSQRSAKSNTKISTVITNKKMEKQESNTDSHKYNSNIIIVHYDEDYEDRSPKNPLIKEVAKINELISKSKEKKKRKSKRKGSTNKSNNSYNTK